MDDSEIKKKLAEDATDAIKKRVHGIDFGTGEGATVFGAASTGPKHPWEAKTIQELLDGIDETMET